MPPRKPATPTEFNEQVRKILARPPKATIPKSAFVGLHPEGARQLPVLIAGVVDILAGDTTFPRARVASALVHTPLEQAQLAYQLGEAARRSAESAERMKGDPPGVESRLVRLR